MRPFFLFLFLAGFSFAANFVDGVLVDSSGQPLGETVFHVEGVEGDFATAEDGTFSLLLEPGSYRLRVYGRRYRVHFKAGERVIVNIHISSRSVTVEMAPVAERLDATALARSGASTVAEALAAEAGVHHSGIGGAKAVVTVGGFSKHRIQNSLNGFRIAGDRRAGSDLGVLVPSLIESVTLYRGETGTTHGSEAMGGVVDTGLPVANGRSQSLTFKSRYGENDKFRQAASILRFPRLVFAMALDKSEGYETPQGKRVDSFFSRRNVWISGKLGQRRVTLIEGFWAEGRDVGKPSTSSTPTVYPVDRLAMASVRSGGDTWDARAAVMKQKLVTEKGSESSTRDSVNTHANAVRRVGDWSFGLDVFSRQKVDARVMSGSSESRPLKNAARLEAAPTVIFDHELGEAWSASFGARGQYVEARNRGKSMDDVFGAGHAGVKREGISNSIAMTFHRNFRFPTLDELFYTGPSGRGSSIGNPELQPEISHSLRLSWSRAWQSRRFELSASAHRISSYIEKTEILTDVFTHRNVGRVTMREVRASYQSVWWQTSVSWVRGELAQTQKPVADIPPLKGVLSVVPPWKKIRPDFRLQLVDSQRRPGPGERARPAWAVVDAGIAWNVASGVEFSLRAYNLLNAEYFPSSDDKAVFAPGRRAVLSLVWTAEKKR